MRDIFYTVVVVWLVWRILSSVNSHRAKKASQTQSSSSKKEGETTVNYVPPQKKPLDATEGEYVDYEEIK